MNLIEKYGSYEAVKQAAVNYKNSGDMVTAAGLELQCLEYRRQHNIFEVGDKVVAIGKDYISTIMTVERVLGRALECFESGYMFSKQGVRHATDAEIAAGHRL